MRKPLFIARAISCLIFSSPYACTATAHAHGAYHEEIQRTDEQIAENPRDGSLWFRRGYLNVLHGEWQTALSDLERADRVEPNKYATDWLRGQALASGNKLDAAKVVLDDFITKYPLHGGALADRARVLIKLGQLEAALADYRDALKKTANPEPDLVQEVANALVSANLHEEAADLIDNHLKRLGHSPGLITLALDLEIKLGRYDAALSRVDAMQKTAPRAEPWMAKRASVLVQAGRIEESKQAWKSLFDHIQALPNLERGAHSMQIIAEQSQHALAALNALSVNTPKAPDSTSSPKP